MSSSLKRKSSKKTKNTGNPRTMKILLIIAAVVAVIGVLGVIISSVLESTSATTNAADSTAASAIESTSAADSGASDTDATDTGATDAASALKTSAADIDVTAYADIAIKDYGTVTVALAGKDAPITVENFTKLAKEGFYDGLTFHRIMDGFMMQGGDPDGNGTGGSDETIKGEFSSNGVENNLSHVKGAISMARSSENDSASSQFFIVQTDSTFLDGSYAAFGFVTEGLDLVDQVCKDAKPTDNNGTIPADQQPVIENITIREVGVESGAEALLSSTVESVTEEAAS